jgi:hypothetical protein
VPFQLALTTDSRDAGLTREVPKTAGQLNAMVHQSELTSSAYCSFGRSTWFERVLDANDLQIVSIEFVEAVRDCLVIGQS